MTASMCISSRVLVTLLSGMIVVAACTPVPPDTNTSLVARGSEIFFNETFEGNGRTCGTCHPAENNFTIDPAFIATLPEDDPLFVAEFNLELKQNFENPRLMREFGLILENQDGFDDLMNNFNMRGVPHTLGLRTSVVSNAGPQTGWSGDGAPGDGSLRAFATGAVIQHFTKTLNRVPAVDFRLPTDEELDALEAFQLSLGRQQDLILPLPLKGVVASRGQEIFNDPISGPCGACHFHAGANADPGIFGPGAGNLNFDTGVETLPDRPAHLTGEVMPPDDGFGTPGDHTFNTPSLVEAADTGPFFHDNSVETIEAAVSFYDGDAFNNSPAGLLLTGINGSRIELDATRIVAIAAFLRVINALENIRQSVEVMEESMQLGFFEREQAAALIRRANHETDDSITVLSSGGLHPGAVTHLREARRLADKGAGSFFFLRNRYTRESLNELESARAQLIDVVPLQRTQK